MPGFDGSTGHPASKRVIATPEGLVPGACLFTGLVALQIVIHTPNSVVVFQNRWMNSYRHSIYIRTFYHVLSTLPKWFKLVYGLVEQVHSISTSQEGIECTKAMK